MPSGLFSKLNLKDHRDIVVLNPPSSFEPELGELAGVAIRRQIRPGHAIDFALVFATRKTEVDSAARALAKGMQGDCIFWIAYPKGTSKRYTCDFNRDTGWGMLGGLGFEPVRQVSIDDDWSALRFRRAEFIESLKRAPERALSAHGKSEAARRAQVRRRK